MKKKIFLFMIILSMLMIGIAAAAPVTDSAFCTATIADGSGAAFNITYNTASTYFTGGIDTSAAGGQDGILNMTTRIDYVLNNKCENYTALNGSTETLNWVVIDSGTFSLTNASNTSETIISGNYTLNETAGTVLFIGGTPYNNTIVQGCYNKTFNTSTNFKDSIYLNKWSASTADYGGAATVTLLDNDINNTQWTIYWTEYTRTCNIRDGCNSTQNVIFAAFGLLALAIIVGAGYMVSMMMTGDVGTSAMIALVIASIGLGIVLMIGYIIISAVGSGVCTV